MCGPVVFFTKFNSILSWVNRKSGQVYHYESERAAYTRVILVFRSVLLVVCSSVFEY